jgi:HEAT repeat protein
MNAILRTSLLALPVALALSACAGGAEDEGAPAPRAAIEEFDSSPRTRAPGLAVLTRAVALDRAAARDAALDLLDAEDGDARLAAVYALGLVLQQGDAASLAPVLDRAAPGERLLAASALTSVGDRRGVPVLIEALDRDDLLPLGAGGIHAWQQARFALLAFTGEDLGLRAARTLTDASATKPSWQDWWAANASSFRVVRAPGRFGP